MIDKVDLSKVQFVIPAEELHKFFKEMESNIIASFTKQIDGKIQAEDDEIMDVKKAAKFLGVSPQTIHNHKAAGKLPFHRGVSGKPYFKKSELMEVIKKAKL